MTTSKYLYLILLLQLSFSGIAGTLTTNDKSLKLLYPDKYVITQINRSDECYELHEVNKRNDYSPGQLCVITLLDKEKAMNLGFLEYSDLPLSEQKFRNYTLKFAYATPLFLYPVTAKSTRVGIAYVSKNVDCDVSDSQPIYRATGTCDVALVSLKGGGAIYISFVIRDDVQKKPISGHADFDLLINSLSYRR